MTRGWLSLIAGVALAGLPSFPALAVPPAAEPGASGKAPLMLFCGAGVRVAAEALIKAYEGDHAVTIAATYAGSGQLLGQIASLQKGDLFMPGEEFYVDQAVGRGLADPASKRAVAFFVPVILVPRGNPKQIRSLADLTWPGLRLGLGDERSCAVGKRAVDLFAKNGIPAEAVAKNTVYKSGTVDELGVAVRLGQVDAVIAWDATARNFEKDADAIAIPPEQNLPAAISIVVLKSSLNTAAAASFADFAASDAAKDVLKVQRFITSVTNAPAGAR